MEGSKRGFEECRPQFRLRAVATGEQSHQEIRYDFQGDRNGNWGFILANPDRSVLPGAGAGSLRKSGLGALIYAVEAGRGDAFPASIGR